MFITCPTTRFKHKMENMGGVRVILNSEEDEGASSMGDKALVEAEEQTNEINEMREKTRERRNSLTRDFSMMSFATHSSPSDVPDSP